MFDVNLKGLLIFWHNGRIHLSAAEYPCQLKSIFTQNTAGRNDRKKLKKKN